MKWSSLRLTPNPLLLTIHISLRRESSESTTKCEEAVPCGESIRQ